MDGRRRSAVRNAGLIVALAATCSFAAQGALADVLPQIDVDVSAEQASVSLEYPQSADPNTLLVKLNGIDVSARFEQARCESAICAYAQLTTADGIARGKNAGAALMLGADG